MEINKTPFYYASFAGKQVTVDEYGNETGEYKLFYNTPVSIRGNISAAKGEAQVQYFGENLDYDKVILIDKKTAIDLQESSILWVDTLPELDAEGQVVTDTDGNVVPAHDYIVKKVAISLNMKQIAIKKVNVSENSQEG